MSALTSLRRLAAAYTHRHMVHGNFSDPVISFAFDDFPLSALKEGGRILEKYYLSGTYYGCFGMAGGASPSGEIAAADDFRACLERGHELGCHTYSHFDGLKYDQVALVNDMHRNRHAAQNLANVTLTQFAYPYGRVGYAIKQAALQVYQSARTTQPGINQGTFDLGMLKAVPLYSQHVTTLCVSYLKQLSSTPGWLIFYTHDVSAMPSAYGCTPQELESLIVQANAQGYTVLPVGKVVSRLAFY